MAKKDKDAAAKFNKDAAAAMKKELARAAKARKEIGKKVQKAAAAGVDKKELKKALERFGIMKNLPAMPTPSLVTTLYPMPKKAAKKSGDKSKRGAGSAPAPCKRSLKDCMESSIRKGASMSEAGKKCMCGMWKCWKGKVTKGCAR
jgi:hypothetical protein